LRKFGVADKYMPSVDSSNKNAHPYYPFLKWGFLHTPFMIYTRSYNKLSDEYLMNLLGLQDYSKTSPPLPFPGSHVVFANDNEWTHIADDYGYTLWHSPQTINAIEILSKSYDVFRNSLGDIDNSFEFEYHHNGELVRKFVFKHDVFEKTEFVAADIGRKLAGEPTTLDDLKSSSENMFPTITQALGIVRVTDPLQNRFYRIKSG